MKICLVGNAERMQFRRFAEGLLEEGHDVSIISNTKVTGDKIKIYHVDACLKKIKDKTNIIKFLKGGLKARKIIEEISPDVIHFHSEGEMSMVLFYEYKDTIMLLSEWGAIEYQNIIHYKMLHKAMKRVDYITSDCEETLNRLSSLIGEDKKLHLFNIGVELELIKTKIENNDSEKFKLISLCPHEPEHRLPLLLDGFYKALKQKENMHLTIGAVGSQKKFLMQLTERMGISRQVEFVGFYNNDVPMDILQNQEVFLSFSTESQMEEKLLQCMGIGMFPIVSDLRMNKKWVENGKNGIILEEVTTDSVCEAIIWAAENRVKLRKIKQKNKRLISEKADFKKNMKVVKQLYFAKQV